MTLPPLPLRLSKKAAAPSSTAGTNAAALGAAATAFFQGAGIGASMMLFQALSDVVARVRAFSFSFASNGSCSEKKNRLFFLSLPSPPLHHFV